MNKYPIAMLFLCCLVLCTPACQPSIDDAGPALSATGPRGRPNVVLVIIDTLRSDKLGCYGFGESTTPEIDALANRSVLFERVLAQCSWTRPSIGSALTGLYPRTLGLYKEIGEVLPDHATTLAELLKAAGYTTIGASANPNVNSVFNFDQGFDEYLDSHAVWSWMDPMMRGEHHPHGEVSGLRPATDLFDWVVDQVGDSSNAPYYIQLVTMEMHEYHRGDLSLTRPEFRGTFPHSRDAAYLDALRQVSHDVDAFVKRLLDMPGWDNTLFILTSDHGEGLTDHPHVPHSTFHANLLYETHILVPLIFYYPCGELPHQRVSRPVRLLDLTPTLLEIIGVCVPEELAGTSLVPLMRNPEAMVPLPTYFVSETYIRAFEKAGVHGSAWHYFENRDRHAGLNPRELQRVGVKADGVHTDRIEASQDIASDMAAYLRDWEQRFPKAEPALQAGGLSAEECNQLRSLGYID